MSYEGREIFICPHGHIYEADTYEFGMGGAFSQEEGDVNPISEKKIRCMICNELMEYVGPVDDTNGESCAKFYLKPLEKYLKITDTYDPETNEKTTIVKPARYEIVRSKNGEHYNFITGELLPDYIDSPDD